MNNWKLVSGILSIVFSMLVLFQSCAAGVAFVFDNSVDTSASSGGIAGVFVACFLLAGGIVSIVTRSSKTNGGNIALLILFSFASVIAFASYGSLYSDLIVWGFWCAINAVLAFIDM